MAWRADGGGGRRESARRKRDDGGQRGVTIAAGMDNLTHRGQPALARTIPRAGPARSVASVGGPGAPRTGTSRGLPQRRNEPRAPTSAQGVPVRARVRTQSGFRAQRMSRRRGYADGMSTSSRHTGGTRRRAGQSRALSRASLWHIYSPGQSKTANFPDDY
ncbi:hypothetical protein FB451DRAFT_1189812 [Mycena latifolia]|nr:hypothetical protein FB451DRAFT_1189812 [Mycena latifolia]